MEIKDDYLVYVFCFSLGGRMDWLRNFMSEGAIMDYQDTVNIG